MKFLHCILISLFSYYGVAQADLVTIKGTVTTIDNNEPVENVYVFYKSSRGESFLKKTDSLGNYEYKIKKDQTSTFTISIGTDKLTKSKSSRFGFLAIRILEPAT